jgi:hypothetical protein
MRCGRRVGTLSCGLLIAALLGCGGDDGAGPPDDGLDLEDAGSDTGSRPCIDDDDDGFMVGCARAASRRDCDDSDPMITDECRRCANPNMPGEGCPCEPGTEPLTVCNPDDVREVRNGVEGIVVCDDGIQWCRDGAWSACEILAQYATFVPDS